AARRVEQAPATAERCVLPAVGPTDPAARRRVAVFVLEHAFKHETLRTAPVAMPGAAAARRPADQRHPLGSKLVQRQNPYTRSRSRLVMRCLGVDDLVHRIAFLVLVQLYEQGAAAVAAGCAAAADWVTHIRTWRIVAMLIRKHAFQNQELLAAVMGMRGEMGVRSIADDRSR